MKKDLTIIVAAYNVEDYIAKCIESLLTQDIKDIEILIVDDGSTDRTAAIASSYAKNNKDITILSKNNGGLSDARNHGLIHARGKYVCFVDGDDFVDNNSLAELIDYTSRNNLDVCIFGYYMDILKDGELVSSDSILEANNIIDKSSHSNISTKITNTHILGYAWNKIYRRELLNQHGLTFQKGLSYVEDITFNEAVYKAAERVGFYNKSIYHYIQRDRVTLGKKYYKNIALYDRQSTLLFCSSLKTLGFDNGYIEKFRLRNTVDRAKWSISIISNTDAVDKAKKITSLKEVSFNLEQVKRSRFKITDTILIYLLKHGWFNVVLAISCFKSGNIVRYLKDSTPSWIKNQIIYHTSRMKIKDNVAKSDKKIIIAVAADYGNLGDVAIAYAQRKFLMENYPGHKIITIPSSQTYKLAKSLKSRMCRDDIITLTGGGNMGDMYLDIEEQRRFLVKKFPKNKIISFPQTIDFSHTDKGRRELRKTTKVYNKHKKLTIFAREDRSYKIMKRYFTCEVGLAPDIVLYLNLDYGENKRDANKAILCLRDDMETVRHGSVEDFKRMLSGRYSNVIYRDTLINASNLSAEESSHSLESIWRDFSSADFVLTDRLHGMIFCAITKTPCVAINNSNGKVKGVFEKWIKNKYPISFIGNISTEKYIEIEKPSYKDAVGIEKRAFSTIKKAMDY